MSEFEIVSSSREVDGRVVEVLSLEGELDAKTFLALQQRLEQISDAERPSVVLDCGNLAYISSAGLGVLNKMTKVFREADGDVRLAALPAKIKSIVDLLGFSQVIQVHGTVDDAVASFGG